MFQKPVNPESTGQISEDAKLSIYFKGVDITLTRHDGMGFTIKNMTAQVDVKLAPGKTKEKIDDTIELIQTMFPGTVVETYGKPLMEVVSISKISPGPSLTFEQLEEAAATEQVSSYVLQSRPFKGQSIAMINPDDLFRFQDIDGFPFERDEQMVRRWRNMLQANPPKKPEVGTVNYLTDDIPF